METKELIKKLSNPEQLTLSQLIETCKEAAVVLEKFALQIEITTERLRTFNEAAENLKG